MDNSRARPRCEDSIIDRITLGKLHRNLLTGRLSLSELYA